MSSPFAQPSAGGDKFEPKEFGPGVLLLIYAKSYSGQTTTKFGDSTSADADVIVVDRPDETGKPRYFQNARLFGNLANSVRDDIGGVVLGRLGQGPNTKGNPPWILLEHNDGDAQLAGPIHQQYQAGLFKKVEPPQGQQPPPQHDPWAGVNAAPAPPPYQAPPQQQYAAPPAPAPAGGGDPNVAVLIQAGIDPAKVAAMDPQLRAQLAATYQ